MPLLLDRAGAVAVIVILVNSEPGNATEPSGILVDLVIALLRSPVRGTATFCVFKPDPPQRVPMVGLACH
jgi:hypothetical protein